MKSRKLAAAIALLGAVTLPGLHRFYLGQPRWGMVYLLLGWKLPISRVASVVEALWYLFLEDAAFDASFNALDDASGESMTSDAEAVSRFLSPFRTPSLQSFSPQPEKISAAATALRDLEQLRQTGLVTEQEFEQQRRALLPSETRQKHRQKRKPSAMPLDVNQASVEDWLQLPNLSIHQARKLTELTQRGVQLHDLEDLAAALNLPPAQLSAWAEQVQFCYYNGQEQAAVALRLDPNQASPEQLERLPGVTPDLVQAWVRQRQQSPFQSLADLSQRLGLSGETTQVLMHYLQV